MKDILLQALPYAISALVGYGAGVRYRKSKTAAVLAILKEAGKKRDGEQK